MIHVYDTMRRALVPLETRDPGRVGMYVCGPTVQSEPHVGHGRAAVAFDVIGRYLRWRGFEVTVVRNVTDVEDKIIAAAVESGEPMAVVAERVGERFNDAYRGLGVPPADHEPKATEHIAEIIDLIGVLVDRGLGYAREGDVYFSVSAFEPYGKLSGMKPEELRSGYRIEVAEAKDDPLDFAMWKGVKPGEPYWDSPWGPGRPGWHIECSAMAERYLGMGFDIHGGGSDLIFPHHENEVAQSEGARGQTFARYWLHNGMVNLGGEKMSKSTGHIVDLASILSSHGGQSLRLLFLRAHYRSPIDFSTALLQDAEEALSRLSRFRERVAPGSADPDALERFREVMDDDFSTPEVVSLLFDLVREGNRIADSGGDASGLAGAVEEIVEVLGIFDARPAPDDVPDVSAVAQRFGVGASGAGAIEALVEMRRLARAERRFDEADAIRAALEDAGVELEDGPHGTRWLRA